MKKIELEEGWLAKKEVHIEISESALKVIQKTPRFKGLTTSSKLPNVWWQGNSVETLINLCKSKGIEVVFKKEEVKTTGEILKAECLCGETGEVFVFNVRRKMNSKTVWIAQDDITFTLAGKKPLKFSPRSIVKGTENGKTSYWLEVWYGNIIGGFWCNVTLTK